jgi:hypothetical protein
VSDVDNTDHSESEEVVIEGGRVIGLNPGDSESEEMEIGGERETGLNPNYFKSEEIVIGDRRVTRQLPRWPVDLDGVSVLVGEGAPSINRVAASKGSKRLIV